ncbi:BCCT family transporter [Tomitella gaofuii]|uniref:BCCT family transporter n=1 Tax=Tomitella gaofuii TaxID=2760083 RepID=UPI0015FBDA7A|nr:BCCT family transporter [Tomitella gaofuii]
MSSSTEEGSAIDEPTQAREPRNPFSSKGPKAIDPVVFWIALGLILVFVVLGAVFPDETGRVAGTALDWVIANLGWAFILAVAGFVTFTLWLALSRYGRIPLGQAGDKPQFSNVSWIALMFAAGMGVGLVFWGVAEPITHMMEPPPDSGVEAGTRGAARVAMQYSFFHWGIQPWAIYGVVGLALAYSTYRKGRGNLLSAPFTPLIGDPENAAGRVINIFAIVVTKFGSATSLGLAGLEIAAGLSYVFGLDASNNVAVISILILTVVFVITAVSGVEKGMKHASNINLVLAFALMMFVLIAGPTVFIFDIFGRSFGDYLWNYIPMTFHTAGFGSEALNGWLSSWTIFYWAWWVSWALHVGTFLARVSKGRTIREFVAGVVIVPALGGMVWFAVFGGAGLKSQLTERNDLWRVMQETNADGGSGPAAALFSLLQEYPWFSVIGTLAIILVAIFFITAADTGAMVLGMLSSRGIPEPRHVISVIWGAMSAAVAIVLLYVGGLDAIETFVILAASPFMLLMIGMAVSFYLDLRHDPLRTQIAPPVRKHAPDPVDTSIEERRRERAEAKRRGGAEDSATSGTAAEEIAGGALLGDPQTVDDRTEGRGGPDSR